MLNIKEIIEKVIFDTVNDNVYKTKYRKPLVGYASSKDPLFYRLKEVAHKDHLLPSDLLSSAKTVVAYFIPFTAELVAENRAHKYVAPSWALAYVETNRLIGDINRRLQEELFKQGVKTSILPATHNFDAETIMSKWSHRHIAFIAGLGTFGINNLLISKKGCAGRYGSFVIDVELKANDIIEEETCLYKKDQSCMYCFDNCPVEALNFERFKREKCYDYLLEVLDHFSDIDSLCDVCGKCNCGPCAII